VTCGMLTSKRHSKRNCHLLRRDLRHADFQASEQSWLLMWNVRFSKRNCHLRRCTRLVEQHAEPLQHILLRRYARKVAKRRGAIQPSRVLGPPVAVALLSLADPAVAWAPVASAASRRPVCAVVVEAPRTVHQHRHRGSSSDEEARCDGGAEQAVGHEERIPVQYDVVPATPSLSQAMETRHANPNDSARGAESGLVVGEIARDARLPRSRAGLLCCCCCCCCCWARCVSAPERPERPRCRAADSQGLVEEAPVANKQRARQEARGLTQGRRGRAPCKRGTTPSPGTVTPCHTAAAA